MDEFYEQYEEAMGLLMNDVSTDSQFKDRYQTRQQQLRDRQITRLLRKYVDAYSNKIAGQRKYRAVLFWGSSAIVVLFCVVIVAIIVCALCGVINIAKTPGAISMITACITLLTAIIGLVTVITKYCFPENDEEYITRIVKSIQDNDLENKKENIKSLKDKTE